MEIKYEILPTDITYYTKEAAKGITSHTIQVFIITTIGILFMLSDMILATLAVIQNDGTIKFESIHIFPRVIIYFVISGFSYLILTTTSKFVAQKLLTTSTGKNGLFCEHTITLQEDGFTETTAVNKNFHSWEGVENITETKNYLTILNRLCSGYFIPKRAFSNENEVREFVSYATRQIATINASTLTRS